MKQLGAKIEMDPRPSRGRQSKMRNQFFVYILASKPRGTLYVGVTNNLPRRVYEHKTGLVEGFTKKYGVTRLVYFEGVDDSENAIAREKQLKKWNRAWKLD